MKIVDLLRKGLGFALMSMGVSRPPQKPRPKSPVAPGSPPEPIPIPYPNTSSDPKPKP